MTREQRRLAGILALDMVGYSRLLGRDESGTVTRWRTHRSQRLEPTLARHGGRLVKMTGDGALVEFASAVEALGAAIEFQQAIADTDAPRAHDDAMAFRIGLHVGDLIVDGDDLYGDGVNVAVRLEAEAEAGGIIISGNVLDATSGRVKATFDDLGELALKNVGRRVKAYRVRWQASDWRVSAPSGTAPSPVKPPVEPALALPEQPSIAVLPFQNMSGDPDHDHFVDGICEDVTTELSRFSSLFVISRNSAFTYKGRAIDVRQVARELGVRYVLVGSGRMSGNRARINAQLIDAQSGGHLWAERYDVVVDDLFDVQEDLTRRIAASVGPRVEAAEASSLRRARPSHMGAYQMAMRAWGDAMAAYQRVDTSLRNNAIAQAEAAIALDARCGRAWTTLAFAWWQHANFRTTDDPAVALARALEASESALEIDPDDYTARVYKGVAQWLAQRFDDALENMREAWRRNPNDVAVLVALGWSEVASGDTASGAQRLREALRLSPRDPQQYNIYTCLCAASFVDGDYAAGIDWGLLGKRLLPTYAPILHYLALNYAGQGDLARAGVEIDSLRRIAPEWLEQRLSGFSGLARPADRARSLALLRKAAGVEA
ncbi:MAG: adenylate/guanylate cyclase domain-containing protein [Reyranella sp.]|uniref:adenylate/guanylate cyclase domain-containing protein n=1 Tax=Reyranella sp. TaxID=1929291 RepID=UPI003D1510A7